jgi:hypothetical protein
MNLTQMIASVGLKSYFSRTRQEIIEAINSASQRLYFWVLKEQQGWFMKWDYSQVFVPPTMVNDAGITQNLAVLTSATAGFKLSDQGTQVSVGGAGPDGEPLVANIKVFTDAQHVTLDQVATATVANAALSFRGAEYKLQPDVERIIRIREQDPVSGVWRIVHSTDFNQMSRLQAMFPSMFAGGASSSSTDSPFQYYGPYEKDDGQFYIQIQPTADEPRPLEIVYNAQYVEIQDENSYFILPPELRDSAKDGAIAECLKPNGDDMWEGYEQGMKDKRNEYLVILRQKTISDPPKVGQYLGDYGAGDDDNWPVIPGSP